HVAASYTASLERGALEGARLGVLHQAYDTPTMDREVVEVFSAALDELRREGAEVIDPVAVADLDAMRRAQTGTCNQFKHDLNRYLAGLGDRAPLKSLEDILKSRSFHPSIQVRLDAAQASADVPGETAGCRSRDEFRARLRA